MGEKKIIVPEDFLKMHEPLLQCLVSITSTDGWDGNSVIQASGLLKSKINSTFIAVFHTIKCFFGLAHRLSLILRGSECDIGDFTLRRNVSAMSRRHCFFLFLHMRKSFVYSTFLKCRFR